MSAKNFRRSFSAAFKRAAILHVEETNNCAAGRKSGVSERVVRQWRLQREKIWPLWLLCAGGSSLRGGLYRAMSWCGRSRSVDSLLMTTCCGTAAAMTAAVPVRSTLVTMSSLSNPINKFPLCEMHSCGFSPPQLFFFFF